MSDQETFVWSAKASVLEEARAKTIDQRFAQFHHTNPEVYSELVALVRKAVARGHKKVGVRMVWEVMRWNRLIQPERNVPDDFKLNDHYHSRYARLIMEHEPDLAGVFELRELRS